MDNKKAYCGVIYTDDGSLVCVRLKKKSGRWGVDAASSWRASNILKTTYLLLNGTALGVRAEWHRRAGGSELEPPIVKMSDDDINPYLHPAEYEIFLEGLSGSVTLTVPDDSYLLTLPLAFCDHPVSSFLSVYYDGCIAVFGVVIAERLEAVFSFPCNDATSVEASAARIGRYWAYVIKRDDFPDKLIIIDVAVPVLTSRGRVFLNGALRGGALSPKKDFKDFDLNDLATLALSPKKDFKDFDFKDLEIERVALPEELQNTGLIKAAGAALAALYPSSPAFRLPLEHAFRGYRRLLVSVSILLLCITAAATLTSAAFNFFADRRLARSEGLYQTRLNENKSLQALSLRADELSAQILSIQRAYAQSTNFGDLMLLLSEAKPDGLFLDRLGSDNIQGSENSIRLALSGWSLAEMPVTDFISGLQARDYMESVSLLSIERDKKNKNLYRFKITCVMQLNKR